MTARAPLRTGELLLSLGLIALGTFVVWETRTIAETQAYAQIGPRLFPYIIGCGLTLCGAVLAWQSVAGGWRHMPQDQAHDAPNWAAFVIITAGVILHMAIIGWAGFIIASIALFVLVARGFGSRRLVRDAIIGAILAVVVFLIFTQALGLALPKGPFNWSDRVDTFSALMSGFAVALTFKNLMWGFLGVTLGTAIGVLPGVGPALTIALLLPATAGLEPTGALIMFAGIYYGAMYGGSTTSILLNTPGESATIVTALEGNMMAKRGRAGPALATSAIGSFVAGTIATILLTVMAPIVVDFALKFGPAEYFAVMVLAFTTVSAVLGASAARGLASLFFGLAIGLIGLDSQTGQARFTLGIPELLDGIDVVVVAVGLFAVGETLYIATYLNRDEDRLEKMKGSIWMSKSDWKRSWKPWLRGTALGFPFGTIPAGGAEIPTFLSYAIEKKLSKNSEEFGKGAIEGVAGPEAANNASATGTLVPLLTLGLPTTATAAIILAAFQQWGLQPGPLLFETQPLLIWGLIASMYVGNVILLILNLPLIGIWVKLLEIPRPLLYAGILIFATLGAYGLRNSWFDLALLYLIGVIGFLMRRFDIPVAPVLVGMILGPLAEQQFRRALAISQGDLSVFVSHPISATVFAITALVLVGPPLWRRFAARRNAPGT